MKNLTLLVPNVLNTSMPGTNASVPDGVQCKCHDGWGGIEGDCRWNVTCPEDCNGNGDCLDGKCFCKDGWYGTTCKKKSCLNMCSGHGICASNRTCVCQSDYTGESCEIRRCPNNCHGTDHGICFNLTCVCKANYFGVDCSQQRCPKDCSNRGKCIHGVCSCQIGYGGEGCNKRLCPGDVEPCSGRGTCDGSSGKCMCRLPWKGRACNISDCYGNGEWNTTASKCICNDGFRGKMCNLKLCPINPATSVECSGHGICNTVNGLCNCHVGFTGRNCEAPFALLSRRNHSWRDGSRYGGNETIDSYARKIDALESAQLMNNTAVEEAYEDRLKLQELNASKFANERNYTIVGSVTKKQGLFTEHFNSSMMDTQVTQDVETAPVVMKDLKLENEFTNVDYGPKRRAWKKYLHQRSAVGEKKNRLGYTKWSKIYDNEQQLRFKESENERMKLVAEAISELDDSGKRLSEKSQDIKRLLRSQ